jgi:predicted ATPase/DNA-binding winged helix-turn-helix (wHTH) protein
MDGRAMSFGPYRLLAAQRLLLDGDKPVRLGGRAFDILAALVERAGEVVAKEVLIARVWPQTFVEEANLKIQVSALRRTLGDGQGGNRYIVTVPGRGYNFVAPVRLEEPSSPARQLEVVPTRGNNLPLAVTRVIGRDDVVATVVARLSRQRLVTIVGPGGVGKTTVALAAAEHMIADYEHGVWLVDLAPLADPRLVPSAVATALGVEINTGDSPAALVAALRDNRTLLLLDNCEHLVDAVASLVVAILSGASGVAILATSREPLRVGGESQYRLRPLGSPQPSPTLTAVEAQGYPAVQLFVERATATVEDFTLTDENAPRVVEICRRLDGLPLAIEFTAPRVAVLGVEALAPRRDGSFPPLSARRRATDPRHQTMRAVVDWSHNLLSADEQRFFRALSVFSGSFTVEAAAAVVADAGKLQVGALDRLADLVAKSLVVADVGGARSRFRLLDTTRAYALEKLDVSGERNRIAYRHAEYYRNMFEHAEAEAAARSAGGEWLATYALEIDNLRAALDWALSPGGNRSTGVALTVAAAPIWMHLSLLNECHNRAKQALGDLGTEGTGDPRQEMMLRSALGASTFEAPEMGAAFTRALDIAKGLGDSEYQLRALCGLYFYHTGSGRYQIALQFAQKFYDLAKSGSDPNHRLYGERTMGVAKHQLGDQISARRHLELVLSHDTTVDYGLSVIRFQTDLRVSARVFLARVLWLQGFPDRAVSAAETGTEEARATGHATSLCYALALAACPIAVWVGNLKGAVRYTEMLLELSRKHSLSLWSAFGSMFQSVIAIKGGNLAAAPRLLQFGIDERPKRSFGFRSLNGLTELVESAVHSGRIVEGLALVEAGIQRSEAGWVTPELLRLKGELFQLQSTPASANAPEALFRQAQDEAHQQKTLSWELRAAMSLARLLRKQGRSDDALAVLQPVYNRFTEGFGTADLIAAKQLLDQLGTPDRD